jgi:cell wall-associated NlpC family hydrolase
MTVLQIREFDDLIGKGFRYGGRGPDEFDCYGLVMECFKRLGVKLPDYLSPEDGASISALITCELRLWKPTTLRPGVLLNLRIPESSHVGFYIGHDRFIHAWAHAGGVCMERYSHWHERKRVLGIYEFNGNG